MEIKLLLLTARNAVIEIKTGVPSIQKVLILYGLMGLNIVRQIG